MPEHGGAALLLRAPHRSREAGGNREAPLLDERRATHLHAASVHHALDAPARPGYRTTRRRAPATEEAVERRRRDPPARPGAPTRSRAPPTSRRASARSTPPSQGHVDQAHAPMVNVPVLSSTIVSTRRMDSSASGRWIRDRARPRGRSRRQGGRRREPHCARAGDDEHGHRRGDTMRHRCGRRPPRRERRDRLHDHDGHEHAGIRLASPCTAGFPPCASATARTICARSESFPRRYPVARTTNAFAAVHRPPAATQTPRASSRAASARR